MSAQEEAQYLRTVLERIVEEDPDGELGTIAALGLIAADQSREVAR